MGACCIAYGKPNKTAVVALAITAVTNHTDNIAGNTLTGNKTLGEQAIVCSMK